MRTSSRIRRIILLELELLALILQDNTVVAMYSRCFTLLHVASLQGLRPHAVVFLVHCYYLTRTVRRVILLFGRNTSALIVCRLQPFRDLTSTLISRKDRVPLTYDLSIDGSQRNAFQHFLSLPLECRHLQGIRKFQVLIAQELVWQMQALRCFLLIRRVLRAQSEDVLNTEASQVISTVAKRACLWGTAACARNSVPRGRNGLA